MKASKRYIVVGVAVVMLVTTFLLAKQPLMLWVQDEVYDSVPSTVPCDQRPSYAQVSKSLEQHDNTVQKIKALGQENEIMIGVTTTPCGNDRAQVLIQYASHEQRVKIQELLKEVDNFSDVPVSLQNV